MSLFNLFLEYKQDSHSFKYFSLAIIIIALFLACTDQNSRIFGKWEFIESVSYLEGQNEVTKNPSGWPKLLEFCQDHTVVNSMQSLGKWIILDDGRIKITNPVGMVFFASIQGDTLTISVLGGKAYVKYKKID